MKLVAQKYCYTLTIIALYEPAFDEEKLKIGKSLFIRILSLPLIRTAIRILIPDDIKGDDSCK